MRCSSSRFTFFQRHVGRVAETGGKNPCIVISDATDLDAVVGHCCCGGRHRPSWAEVE